MTLLLPLDHCLLILIEVVILSIRHSFGWLVFYTHNPLKYIASWVIFVVKKTWVFSTRIGLFLTVAPPEVSSVWTTAKWCVHATGIALLTSSYF